MSPSAHTYHQSVAHAFTICRICGVFAVTLIWIVQIYLQLLSCPVISIIAIHFWMVLPTLTSLGFSVFTTDWPTWWQSLLHLLAAFRCFVSFIGCQWGLEYCLRSIFWPTACLSSLHASLSSHSLRSNNDNSLSVPRVKTNTGARAFHDCAPLFGTTSRCAHSAISVATFKKHLKTLLFDFSLSPIDTSMPDGLLMLLNCFLDFAVEHWFGCRATEPGFARDIGTIEIWLIDSEVFT